jgi:hypothetical protein
MSFSCSTSKGEREAKIAFGILYTEEVGFIPVLLKYGKIDRRVRGGTQRENQDIG